MNPPFDVFLRTRAIFSQEHIAGFLSMDIRTIRRWEKSGKAPKAALIALKELLNGQAFAEAVGEDRPAVPYGRRFTFVDLFAGIGGTRLGLESAGGRCVFTSEWDRFSCQTYRANHADTHAIRGDITQIPADDIPPHDVLVAGFPCQPFSLAGVSKKNSLGRKHGFLDVTQGTLFFDIARILKAKRPRAFLLENVKNLKSHDRGKTFQVILRTLRDELGYTVAERVVDAACLVPQHRERIFIVGFRDGEVFDWDGVDLPLREDGPKLAAILHRPDERAEPPYTEERRGKTVAGGKYTLSDHLWGYLQAYAEKHRAKGNGFGCSVFTPDDVARTLSARYHKDGSEILIRQPRKNPRRLTPRECARLMGFPDTFRIPVSDTQAYRQFGNSVVVPVVERVAKAMAVVLRGETLPAKSEYGQLTLPGLVAEDAPLSRAG
ncbi:MAG: DNA (cytosine-5-)-methyltransferase [Opitutales bacterium]|nr:DNA (cytosine-5-)-methyltransferase [Opitutales bacterium]